MNTEENVQMLDLVGMLRRRGKLIVAIAGGLMLAVFWISMAIPNSYTATALILVEPQSIDESLIAAGVRESDLAQRLGIMTSQILSRARLSTIIDDFNLYVDKRDEYTREEIVQTMRSDVSVAPVLNELEVRQRNLTTDDFNTFEISFEFSSGFVAADVVNRIAQDFISEHIDARVKTSTKSLDFMVSSIEGLTSRIAELEAEIARVKGANAGRLPEDLQANQRAYAEALSALRMAQRQHAEAVSDAAFWRSQVIAAVSLTSPSDPTNPVNRRKMLAMELADLLGRGYTERHPDTIKIRNELQLLDQQLKHDEEKAAQDEDAPISYAEQNARSEQRRAELRASTLEEEVNRLAEQLADLDEKIAGTPAVAEKLDALTREYDHLYKSFQEFSAKLQQAQVQADLERRQLGEQLQILEPAFPPPKPTSPNRVLILILGLVVGLAMGGGGAFVAESIDASVHTARDLQVALSIPVLAAIPDIMLESDRAARARRLVIQVVAAGAVAVFCVIGGVVTYMYVNGGLFGGGSQVEETTKAAQG